MITFPNLKFSSGPRFTPTRHTGSVKSDDASLLDRQRGATAPDANDLNRFVRSTGQYVRYLLANEGSPDLDWDSPGFTASPREPSSCESREESVEYMPDHLAPDDVVSEQSRPQFLESVRPIVVGDDDPELDPPPGSSDGCWTWSVRQRVGGLALAVAGGALYLLFVAHTWPVWIGILGVAFVVWGLGLAATSGPTHSESATH